MNSSKQNIKKHIKILDDKYFMIIIEGVNSSDLYNLKNDIYAISKDEDKILLPINKYIRNSFNLLENNINQKYFLKKKI